MCGTSLDAIDIALIDTANQCKLLAAAEAPLPSALRNALLALCSAGDNEIERMGQADRELALALAQAVNQFLLYLSCEEAYGHTIDRSIIKLK